MAAEVGRLEAHVCTGRAVIDKLHSAHLAAPLKWMPFVGFMRLTFFFFQRINNIIKCGLATLKSYHLATLRVAISLRVG